MDDPRHKASPPDFPEELVTDAFVEAVNATLEANRTHNQLRQLRKGDPDYRISNRSELAFAATNDDQTLLSKIIGAAKATTKIRRIERSRYVGAIRAALKLPSPRVAPMPVPIERIPTLRVIADLSDEDFLVFEKAVNDRVAKLNARRRGKN